MELNALRCRDPHGAIGVSVGEGIEGEILLGCEPPAWNADTHHELPDFVVTALLALGGAVAVVALVDSVEFEERVALIVERSAGIAEIAGDVPAQLTALLLDRLGIRNRFDLNHIASFSRPAA